jgi:anaerobic magnesium-protoporphyrin IX monomethyl ester cyclase
MNILLIRPPATFYPGAVRPLISLPVGLLSMAALLERDSFQVSVYDAQLNVSNPVAQVGSTIVMGDTWDTVDANLRSSAANIIGISCGFSSQLSNTLKTAALARKSHPDAIIIVGGPHASVMPNDLLQEGSPINLVCIGEGENTLRDLASVVASGGDITTIAGTVTRCNGAVKINQPRPPIADLDELPFPAYHLVTMEHYFQLFETGFADRPLLFQKDSHRAVSVVTSRGCPFNCIFCSIHLHMGRRWRGNSAEYVTRHIELLVHNYGIKHIHFEDDNISFNIDRFEGIVSGLSDFKITWDTPNGVRVDTLTEQVVKNCKKSGCTYLVFGVESGNQHVLDSIIDKRLDLSAVHNAATWCKNAGLDAMAFYVIGFPGEMPADMQETVEFALNLYRDYDVKPNLFLATPLPGTRLEKILLDKKLIAAPLSTEQLAAMTQGQFRVDGGTFSCADIDLVMKRFVSGYRKQFVINAMKFLISRPYAIVRVLMVMCSFNSSMSLMNRLFSVLQLKHSALELRR